ncbi:DUF1549 domain-containing protein [Haloferula sargassicola]|uniref:DUF1549 domain-containing protein n=1 Tax=Haloferula sargassicola TaxID=490096 RepID=A0ABP9UUA8_9BACT
MKSFQPLIVAFSVAWATWLSAAPEKGRSESARAAALKIDGFVAGWYREEKLEVPEITDDATFLRRAYLVTVGRIPTVEEARFFLELQDPGKRSELVDYLLDSPGYGSHMSNWAFDLLRVTDDKPGFPGNFDAYRAWVREAVDANMHWDELTTRLVASSGNPWSESGAAVGYYLRDRGMPLDNLANTTRIFLGSRMECAQCHDDPFGVTERLDFYQLAAFTNGQQEVSRAPMKKLWDEVTEDEQRNSFERSVAQVIWDDVYGMSFKGGGKGRIRLPDDYQYRGAEPGEMVGARTPFGKTVRLSERDDADDGREKLAEWITSRTGDQFASVIANRMWKHVMGRGIYEPIDEYQPAEKTHLPGLMRYLTRLMIDLDYDLKEFQRVILNTKTFQFVPNPEPPKVAGGDDFHGRQLERMSAEQIWDSLITLVGGNPDGKAHRGVDRRIRIGGKPVSLGGKDLEQLYDEVVQLDSESEFRSYFASMVAEARKEHDGEGGGGAMMMNESPKRYGGNEQVRASELPSPAPRDHLLYLFGQSDREVVEGASREPNVGQVLSLMNGFVQQQLVQNRGAHIYEGLEGTRDPRERIRRLYIAILNRPPGEDEMSWMMDEVKLSGDEAWPNMVSALVMSSEFLFVQ